MKNPFVAVALAAVAAANAMRVQTIAAFRAGDFVVEQPRPASYARKTGLTTASVKRAAIKAKNRARHRAACRG